MNRNYTLEDVEALRAKSGISYEEAVALLDKYDGDMARALIELEKRGVIDPKKNNKSGESFSAWLQRIWALGMRTRIHVTKNDQTLIIVTHDIEIAQYANTIIYIRDGNIEKIETTDVAGLPPANEGAGFA